MLRTLGSGAMGTVFLAYDPELDRKVALKLLHGGNSPGRSRALLREAQAMAKLSHPNVVGVHDVGEHEHAVYVAMEFVEGLTLRAWLAGGRRRWREVLERFLEAGRGLEAAHRRGLIHRDFKPDNVMVSNTDRALVMDFGLARPAADSFEHAVDDDSISGAVLTEATVGRVAGTPAYMAPEQALASTLTAAVDQFAFCVSLWEGLCGERPFEGPTYPEMLRNISEGQVRSPPSDRRVPRWLKRALLRGMRPEAKDRWPSMQALLGTLEAGRGRWRWQVGLGVLVTAAVPLGITAEHQRRLDRAHDARLEACETEGETIVEVWNDAARDRLRNGLLATGVSFGEDSVETLVPWLDAYTQAWRDGRAQACLHTSVHADWTKEQADRAMWCFEDRRLQLEATVDQISGGDAKAARRAVRLASYLDPVEACLDVGLLERLPAPPEALRDAIRSVRARLIESDRLRHGGMFAQAHTVARDARVQAEQLEWPPLVASARMLEGRSLLEAGRSAEADPVLTNTFFEALDTGSVEVAFRAARSLVKVNVALQRYREAENWARHADAVASDKVDRGGLDEAEGHYLRIEVYRGLGDYTTAAIEGTLAVEQRARTLGEQHPITTAAKRNLGLALLDQGRAAEALELAEVAYASWHDAVGPAHPAVGSLALIRGSATLALGRPDDALPLVQEGLAVFEAALAEGHPTIGGAHGELGRVYAALGRLDEAERAFDRSMAISAARLGSKHRNVATRLLQASEVDRKRGRFDDATRKCNRAAELLRAALDPGHPEVAAATETLADVYLDRGRPEHAVELRRSALAEREAARGPQHRQLVTPLTRLGDAQHAAGRVDDARQSYARALAIGEAVAGDNDAMLVLPLSGLAEVALENGDGTRASRLARRAVRIGDAQNSGHRESGRALFVLAQALAVTGASAGDVQSVAARARAAYVTLRAPSEVAKVDGWLATR